MTNSVIPIFLAFDNKYAACASVTITSIILNTDCYVTFYLLECCEEGISLENKKKIESLKNLKNNFSIEWIYVNPSIFFNGFTTFSYISLATYGRLLIPTLKPNLEKIIYLDVDLIVTDDIKKLFECNLEDYPLGAVYDGYNEENNINSKLISNLGCSPFHKYFNAGVLLIDVKKWNLLNISVNILKLENEIRTKLIFADQDLLNVYFNCNYKMLDPSFNVSHKRSRNYYKKGKLVNCVIRHFVGDKKPWLVHPLKSEIIKKDYIGKSVFWKYALLTPYKYELLARFPIFCVFCKLLRK